MKKLILLSTVVAILASQLKAQSFSINPKNINTGGFVSKEQIALSTVFTNISSDNNDTSFTWSLISFTKPNGWTLSMCDPKNCYAGITEGTRNTFTLGKNKPYTLTIDFLIDSSRMGGLANAKIVFTSDKTNNKDTLNMDIKGWYASVKELSKNKEISLYPNPAKDNLILKYTSKESLQVDIYNVLGLKIKSVIYNNNDSNIDISDLQNGVYFIRFKDDGKVISKSFTKAE